MFYVLALVTLSCLPTALTEQDPPRPDASPYKPTWESLDSRPLPEWFDEAKFGIFIHWGPYSVPAFGGAWLWEFWEGEKPYVQPSMKKFMADHYPPDWTYADWAKDFHAWFYDPKKWAKMFKNAGAKYVVQTSKHCDGFNQFPSPYSFNWNSKDVGPNRDLVGELVSALRNESDMRVGLYYAHYEFFNKLFVQDKERNFTTHTYVDTKINPDLKYIINNYKPDLLWSDAIWVATSPYWKSTEFLAWLYNDSPVKDYIVTNDRWGSECFCKHGGYFTCHDRYNPKKLMKYKWENCMTIDEQYWAYLINRDISNYLSIQELIATLASTVSCGGNMLMDVGPTSQGTIPPIFQERLMQMGEWLGTNGDAIYATHPCKVQNDSLTPSVWYTCKDSASDSVDVYAIMLEWPEGPVLSLEAGTPSDETKISMLGYPGSLTWKSRSGGGLDVTIPSIPINKIPSLWAWTLKIENLQSPGLAWTKKDFKAWQHDSDIEDNTLIFKPGPS